MLFLIYFPNSLTSHDPNRHDHESDKLPSHLKQLFLPAYQAPLALLQAKTFFKEPNQFMFLSYIMLLKDFPSCLE